MIELAPVLWAFAIGALSFLAPCSVAMLPAYVSYYITRAPPGAVPEPATPRRTGLGLAVAAAGAALVALALWDLWRVGSGRAALSVLPPAAAVAGTALVVGGARSLDRERARRGAAFGLLAASGILVVFVAVGIPFSGLVGTLGPRARFLLVLAVAAALIVMGVLGLLGRDVRLALPVRAPARRDASGMFVFGAGYGIVALGCNFPLFVAAAAGPLLAPGGVDALTAALALVAYGAGMALFLLALTVAVALSRGAVEARLRAAMPPVRLVGNALLVAAGAYIIWYDWTVLGVGS